MRTTTDTPNQHFSKECFNGKYNANTSLPLMIFDIDCILRVHPYFLPLSFTQSYKGTVANPSVSVWLKVALNPLASYWSLTGSRQRHNHQPRPCWHLNLTIASLIICTSLDCGWKPGRPKRRGQTQRRPIVQVRIKPTTLSLWGAGTASLRHSCPSLILFQWIPPIFQVEKLKKAVIAMLMFTLAMGSCFTFMFADCPIFLFSNRIMSYDKRMHISSGIIMK